MAEAYVALDIETISIPLTASRIAEFEADYKAPANYKSPEAIEGHKQRALESFQERYHFRIDGCRPICIGLGLVGQSGVNNITSCFSNEPDEIATCFVDYLAPFEQCRLVGFNLKNFDLPVLAVAVHKAGLRLRRPIGKWKKLDLMDELRGYTLKAAAAAFGIKIPELRGSDVANLYELGDFESIEKYNREDVRITGELCSAMSRIYDFS